MEAIMNSYDEEQEVDNNQMEVDEEPALTTTVPEETTTSQEPVISPSHEQDVQAEDSPMEVDNEITPDDVITSNNHDLGDNSNESTSEEKASEVTESEPVPDSIPEQNSPSEPEHDTSMEIEEHQHNNEISKSETMEVQPAEEEVNEKTESLQIVESTSQEEEQAVHESHEANKPDEDQVVEVEVSGGSSSDDDSSEEEVVQVEAAEEIQIPESNNQQLEKEETGQITESVNNEETPAGADNQVLEKEGTEQMINNEIVPANVDTNEVEQIPNNTQLIEEESPEQPGGEKDNISSVEATVEANVELLESTVDVPASQEDSSKPSDEGDETTMQTEIDMEQQQPPQESTITTEEDATQKEDAVPESDPEKEMLQLMSTLVESVTNTETTASSSIQTAENEQEEAPTISNYSENELMEMMEVVTTSEHRMESTDSPSQLGSEGSTAEDSSNSSDDIFTHKSTVNMEERESSGVESQQTRDVQTQSSEATAKSKAANKESNEEFNESWMHMDEGEHTESQGADKSNQQDNTNINSISSYGGELTESNEVGTPATTTTTNATTTAIDSEEEEFQLKTSRKKPSNMFAPDTTNAQNVAKQQPVATVASNTNAAASDKRDLTFLQNNFSFQQAPLQPAPTSSTFKATLPEDKYDPIGVNLLAVQSTLSTALLAMVKKRNFKATAGRKRKLEEALLLIRQGCDLLAAELTDPATSST